ncbi:MAG: tetratricopeptide repeat protein [Cyanobacteria bacterium SZAS LIN-5]|nr:tetratricopeptide repeat protein [Cyanobacteria bacterium SZAS LIN-5]
MNLENTAKSVTRKACISCGQEFSGDTAVCPHDGTTLTPLVQEDMVGKIIGEKYEVLETIGGGGMGMIYKAKHILMKRIVAIKMMHPQYVSSASNLKRFQQEAQAASALNHPNILAVFDFGLTPEGAPYLVMDFLEGTNLAEVLDELGLLPASRATNIFAQACAGLAHAHSKGVIHRDLKPGNIMLVEFDQRKDFVKIVDFGIAKVLPSGDESESSHLTATGEVFGSPLYMSPEQCRGRNLDIRSDIYSLGCVMYRTLTGSSPFFGQDPMECMYKQVNEAPNKFFDANPDSKVPEALEAIVFKCLAKEPADRYQTMHELKDALLEFAINTPGVVLDPEVLGSLQSSTTLTPLVKPATPLENTREITKPQKQTKPPNNAELTPANAATAPLPSSGQAVAGSGANAGSQPATSGTGAQQGTSGAAANGQSGQAGQGAGRWTSSHKKPAQPAWMHWAPIAAAVVVVIVGLGVAVKIASNRPQSTGQPAQHTVSFDNSMDIASNFYNKADYSSATNQINETLKRNDLTDDRKAEALNLLGDIEREAFQYDGAISSYQQVLDIENKSKEPKQSFIAHALNGLGHIYTKKGEVGKAREALNKALKIDQDFSGDDHIEFARTSFELGNLALKEGKIADAKKYLLQAKQIIENAKGPNDPETASVCNALAQVYQYDGKYKDAEALYNKALKIRTTKLTPGNIETADTLLCLGTLDFATRKYASAESQLQQALSIYQKKFGDRNETVAENQFCLAVLYDQQKQYAKAEPFYKGAYETQKQILGANNPKTLRTQKYYANVLTKLRKTDQAQKVLSGQ